MSGRRQWRWYVVFGAESLFFFAFMLATYFLLKDGPGEAFKTLGDFADFL
jgi:hypothetical protein